MQRTMAPQTANSFSWSNPGNALVFDAQFSVLPPGLDNGYLLLNDLSDRFIEGNIEVIGISVDLYCGVPPGEIDITFPTPPDTFQRLEVWLTINGVVPVGDPMYVDYEHTTLTVGSNTSLWGRSWVKSNFEGSGFGVLVRRADVLGNEETGTQRRLNYATVTVHFNYDGGSLTMPYDARPIGSQRFVIAKEATPGAPTAPSVMLKHSKIDFASTPQYEDILTYGSMLPEGQTLNYEIAQGDLQVTSPDYNELAFWISARFGKPETTTLATGVYQHEWTIDPRKTRPSWTFSSQRGDFNVGEANSFCVLRSLGFDFSSLQTRPTMSGSAFARPDLDLRNGGNTDSKGIEGGVNCVQTIAAPTGAPTGGTVAYRVRGAVASWAHNANAAAVQSALVALATVGAGGATVTGTGPWVITFSGANAGREMPLIEVDASTALTGGTTPAAGAVTMTTKGGWTEYPTAPVVGGTMSCFIADTLALLPSNKVSDLKNLTWNATEDIEADDAFGSTAGLTFDRTVTKPYEISLGFGIERNSLAYPYITRSRDNSYRYGRMTVSSAQIVGTGITYSMSIDMYGQLKDMGAVETMGQVVGRKFSLNCRYDVNWGRGARIRLVCAVPGTVL